MQKNKDNTKVLSEDWSDELLIKDQEGKLRPLKDQDLQANSQQKSVDLAISPVSKPAPPPLDDKFLPVPNTGKADKGAAFAFHPDDEEEVKNIAKNLPVDDSKKYSLEKIIDKLVNKHNLKFDPTNLDRFTNILFDFFRNRKNAIIVRELLSRDVMTQGKVLSEDSINSLVSVAKAIKENIAQEGGLVVRAADLAAEQAKQTKAADTVLEPVKVTSSEAQPALADLEKELNAEIKEGAEETEEEPQSEIQNILTAMSDKKTDEKKEPASKEKPVPAKPAAKLPKPEVPKEPAPKLIAKTKEVKKLPKAEVAAPSALPKVSRPSQAPKAKKQMADVVTKQAPPTPEPTPKEDVPQKAPKATLTGAVEELQNLTLENFRRLGNSPSAQTDKLLTKINLLEKDSVTKKAQGIEAWRHSQVYGLYLGLGEESLSQGKDVAAIIGQHQAENKPTLTLEEFSVVSDLNKRLRF
jgi:hypothetical protein